MTPKRFEAWLAAAIDQQRAEAEPGDPIREVQTFADAGILTSDRGLVIQFGNGSEIQVTLVLSQRSRNDEDYEEDEDSE